VRATDCCSSCVDYEEYVYSIEATATEDEALESVDNEEKVTAAAPETEEEEVDAHEKA
jgi:hypothetical protein